MNCDEVDALFEAQERLIETLTEVLQAFADQLDSEELGEPGLSGRDWIDHWEQMHAAAHTALAQARKGKQP